MFLLYSTKEKSAHFNKKSPYHQLISIYFSLERIIYKQPKIARKNTPFCVTLSCYIVYNKLLPTNHNFFSDYFAEILPDGV